MLVAAAEAAERTVPNVAYDIAEDGDRYLRSALINIDNQVEAAHGAPIDMVVVLHGSGIALARKAKDNEDLRARLAALKRAGVSIRVCGATLAQRHLDYRRDLYDVHREDIVPNGVAELVRLQQLDFVYVKP